MSYIMFLVIRLAGADVVLTTYNLVQRDLKITDELKSGYDKPVNDTNKVNGESL